MYSTRALVYVAMKYIYLLNLDRESTINNGTHKLVNSGNDSLVHVIVFV